jgi:hypothetical protein
MAVWRSASLKAHDKSITCCGVKRERHFSCSSGIGNLEFSSLVFTSLSVAIEAWEAASEAKARSHLSNFNTVATVLKWGVLKQTKGSNNLKC